ncbi:tetratricopeptide repeat protein [Marinobacter halophilus]|uniref:Sel1 repeat family protein n=1 Tax=Marinobacter halophilus TaxID=1323740 RepID=A0A2T1KBL5_9GAMM|nr:sel1 repeat family protein [Marinobacter halophilus]PSF07529.1 hypothetical protein C7H08_13885 [Marinobacter halophilus]GGC80131.1 hypothetical protein GCM10011362_30870 [Marinobacter halophilus]
MTKYSPVWCVVFWLMIAPVTAQSQSDDGRADELFLEGYMLYQQYAGGRSLPKFKKAAELGHIEAAYYAGNVIRRNHTFMTSESEHYYRQAADGGDVYAMLRLAQKDSVCGTLRNCDYDREAWLERALELSLPRAEAGDTEAMMALSSAYAIKGDSASDLKWVERAAENGHAFAQYWMAVMLSEQERGFYWTEAGRQRDVLKWLKASAVSGYPKAMYKLAVTLRAQGRLEEARYWVEVMGKTDYYDAVLESGVQLMMGPDVGDIFSPTISYQFEKPRPVEGAALLLALHRQTGKDAPLEMIEAYQEHLTPEIMAEVETRSKELLVDTPVIYYLPKFGI